MKFHKVNRFLHRELGFFFVGMTIIYAISGIAINHINDWNPNYSISQETIKLENVPQSVSKDDAIKILSQFKDAELYKSHYYPQAGVLKIFYRGGSIIVNTETGNGYIEEMRRRPILFYFNKLHYNPNFAWTISSDIFAVSLFIIAVTGLFVNKGKHGIKGRGGILAIIGAIIPLLFILFF